MNKQERIAVTRILADLVRAGGFVTVGGMERYAAAVRKFGITSESGRQADSVSLADAFQSVFRSKVCRSLLTECEAVAGDNRPAEAVLLLMALRHCLRDGSACDGELLSILSPETVQDSKQVLYVESAFDDTVNGEIAAAYRQICNELRLAGFHFVYVPRVASRYKSVGQQQVPVLMQLIAPHLPEEEASALLEGLSSMTTESFCRDQLCDRLGMHSLRDSGPALLFPVGDDYVGGRRYCNFLRLALQGGVVDSVCRFVEEFVSMASPGVVAVPLENELESAFPLTGFHGLFIKQFSVREGKRCGLVIDPFHGTLFLPEIQTEILGLHRKEKAFYAMLVHMTRTGGINFTAPSSKADFRAYERHIRSVKEQFAQWYGLFGGDRSKAPDIENPGIRNPIISVIRTALYNLTPKLLNVKDFNICKSESGGYIVPLDPASVTIRQFPKENDP